MDQAEQIRREHLNRETSVRGIGCLFYLGTLFSILITAWSIFKLSDDGRPVTVQLFNFGMLGLVALLAVVQGWVAHGLRALNGSVRLWAVALSGLGLINFPIGTVISIYFIYVLVSAKGRFVMTSEYAAIRAATPHIRYRSPIWLWIVLGFLVLSLLLPVLAVSTLYIHGLAPLPEIDPLDRFVIMKPGSGEALLVPSGVIM